LLGGGDLEVYLVVLDRLLRATTKKSKKVVNFFEEKSAPGQNPGYAYVSPVFLAA